MRVVVFGSYVTDLMGRAGHLPTPGETVMGSLFQMGPGGKGFNQGVAAHKSGADMVMVTKIGRDAFADVPIQTMRDLGMDTSHILYSDTKETGAALIAVDENTSENQILVVPGASGDITKADTDKVAGLIEDADFLLTQLETNLDSVVSVIDMAFERNVKVILNTAPIQEIDDALLGKVYIVTPNEVEAEYLTGVKVTDLDTAIEAANVLKSKGVEQVVITLGSKGVFISNDEFEEIIPAFKVDAVDTTGAGDAFNGGFVTALSEGKNIKEAAVFGNAVAALSVQKMGTTVSMPGRGEVEGFLESVGG
ncbi:ribokinase [Aerococcaceae bacterium DSM 111176]|nr:ribokinase [Aerococcaceae bacterium DSM 111176]